MPLKTLKSTTNGQPEATTSSSSLLPTSTRPPAQQSATLASSRNDGQNGDNQMPKGRRNKFGRSMFSIRRNQQRDEQQQRRRHGAESEETLKISDSPSGQNGQRRRRHSSASIFSPFTIPCCLLCLLFTTLLILLFLVTGYHLGKYLGPPPFAAAANETIGATNELMDDGKGAEERADLMMVAGWHFPMMAQGGDRREHLIRADTALNENGDRNGTSGDKQEGKVPTLLDAVNWKKPDAEEQRRRGAIQAQQDNGQLSGILLRNGTGENDGRTPLHFAAEEGNIELMEMLVENGADIKARDKKGQTPLHYAALNGHLEGTMLLLKKLEENGEEAEEEEELKLALEELGKRGGGGGEGKRTLTTALAKMESKKGGGHKQQPGEVPTELPQLKLQEYMHLGEMRRLKGGRQSWGDLLKAAKHGKTELVRSLLDQGAADINATRNAYGNTALHLAATYGHLETVKLLLERRADVGAKNTKQQGALYYAACEGKEQVVLLLIQNGANVNGRGKDGNSALHCAAEEGWDRVERVLIENGAEVDAKNGRGYTPLHWAAQYGKAAACSTLLANGADVKARVTSHQVTALHLAAQEGHKHVVELLLAKGADVAEERDRHGWTALHYAIRGGRIGCTKVLLAHWRGELSAKDSAALFALIHRDDAPIKELVMRRVFHR